MITLHNMAINSHALCLIIINMIMKFFMIRTSTCSAQMVPALYVFGDSLVDVGNNNYFTSLSKANFPRNGIDYPGSKATGRFCNGKNAADFLAEQMGLSSPPPYLSFTNTSNITTKGVSFASGGAGILDSSSRLYSQSLSLNKQIEYYSQVYASLVEHRGSVEAQKHLSKSIFGFVIGSNDFFAYFLSQRTSTPQQYINLLLLTFKGQLKRSYNLGARKVVVAGIGTLGCTPAVRNVNETNCNEEINSWSLKYNEAAFKMLLEMKAELKDFIFSFFNSYTALTELITEPNHYGLKEVKAACCGMGSLNAMVGCLPISPCCNNRSEHVFWDAVHPTEKVHLIFADFILDGTPPYVYPINLRQLITL